MHDAQSSGPERHSLVRGGVAEEEYRLRNRQGRSAFRTGHASSFVLQANCARRTATYGTLANKPPNKPLHLTAARSLARR
jgi:hypothetical protein